MKKDLVSIIIPSYNSKELLIESVNSVVNQSHKNIELIVVDDGSNDGTTELFSDFEKLGVKCFSQKNKGAAAARNLALKHISGDYVQYLDADDMLHQDKLLIQLEVMKKDNADLSFCFWGRFTDDIKDVQPFVFQHIDYSDINNGKDIMRLYGMKHLSGTIHSMLVRRDIIDKVGGWEESLRINNDGEYFSRVYYNTKKVSVLKQQLVYHRVGRVGTVSNMNSIQKAESALKSWDLVHELVSKDKDKTLLSYPKKGYYLNYIMTKYKFPEYAKIFAKRFNSIKEPCFLNEWKYYWIVKWFGLYYGAFVFWGLVKFKIIKTNYYPI